MDSADTCTAPPPPHTHTVFTPRTLPPAAGQALSRRLRRGLYQYDFRPLEILALIVLCEETFDRHLMVPGPDPAVPATWCHRPVAGGTTHPADFARWSKLLGLRGDKFRRQVWTELVKLLVIDWNENQATYELRPEISHWSRLRAYRVPVIEEDPAQDYLPLPEERPLSESLSECAREAALEADPPAIHDGSSRGDETLISPREVTHPPAAPDAPEPLSAPAGKVRASSPRLLQNETPAVTVDWAALRESISRGTVDQDFAAIIPPADLSAAPGSARPQNRAPQPADKSAGTLASAKNTGNTGLCCVSDRPADLSSGVARTRAPVAKAIAIASLALYDPKAKLARGASPAADLSAAPYEEPPVITPPEITPDAAFRWLAETDTRGHLALDDVTEQPVNALCTRQWVGLCQDDPAYVLQKLRRCWRGRNQQTTVHDPLAYLSRIVRDDRKFR